MVILLTEQEFSLNPIFNSWIKNAQTSDAGLSGWSTLPQLPNNSREEASIKSVLRVKIHPETLGSRMYISVLLVSHTVTMRDDGQWLANSPLKL